jgi:hypothetical protein
VPNTISLARPKEDLRAIGRSRGVRGTKVRNAVDGLDRLLRLIPSAGQIADIEGAADLIADRRI